MVQAHTQVQAQVQHASAVHALHWFEIPVTDIDRAQDFYETVLAASLQREGDGDRTMALFPSEGEGVGGCLSIGNEISRPGASGAVVYLSTADIDGVLARVDAAGGRVVSPKTQLPQDWGHCAHITDTEGNRVGLHSLA